MSTIPVYFYHPQLIGTFDVVAAMVWGVVGFGFALGFRQRLSAA